MSVIYRLINIRYLSVNQYQLFIGESISDIYQLIITTTTTTTTTTTIFVSSLTYLQLGWTGPQVASASLGGPV